MFQKILKKLIQIDMVKSFIKADTEIIDKKTFWKLYFKFNL